MCKSSPTSALKAISPDQFFAMSKANDCVVVYDGMVCNLSNFKHPGGDFLCKLNGTDASEYIRLSHATDKRVAKILHARCVGRLEDPNSLLSPEDKDFRELDRHYKATGRFHYRGFASLIEPSLIAGTAFALHLLGFSWLAWASVLFIAYIRFFWWAHDAMHHCYFAEGKTADRAVECVSFLVFGAFLRGVLREHAVHHVFANVLEQDWYGLGPFQIDRRHSASSPAWFVRIQAVVWFGLMPFSSVAYWIGIFVKHWTPFQRALAILRFTLVWFLDATLWATVLPFAACSVCLYISTLNHFHMDKVGDVSERPASFVRAMAEPTCNIKGTRLWTWISGGLDLHIEHHLFPTMAQHHLPAVKHDVRALLNRHGVPYHELPLPEVIWLNFLQLLQPYRETMGGLSQK